MQRRLHRMAIHGRVSAALCALVLAAPACKADEDTSGNPLAPKVRGTALTCPGGYVPDIGTNMKNNGGFHLEDQAVIYFFDAYLGAEKKSKTLLLTNEDGVSPTKAYLIAVGPAVQELLDKGDKLEKEEREKLGAILGSLLRQSDEMLNKNADWVSTEWVMGYSRYQWIEVLNLWKSDRSESMSVREAGGPHMQEFRFLQKRETFAPRSDGAAAQDWYKEVIAFPEDDRRYASRTLSIGWQCEGSNLVLHKLKAISERRVNKYGEVSIKAKFILVRTYTVPLLPDNGEE